jgi:hypothetical protein
MAKILTFFPSFLQQYFFLFFRLKIYCDVSEIGNGPTNLTRVGREKKIMGKIPFATLFQAK